MHNRLGMVFHAQFVDYTLLTQKNAQKVPQKTLLKSSWKHKKQAKMAYLMQKSDCLKLRYSYVANTCGTNKKTCKTGLSNGRDDMIRTCDPLVPSEVRYQAALHPEVNFNIKCKIKIFFRQVFFIFCYFKVCMLSLSYGKAY